MAGRGRREVQMGMREKERGSSAGGQGRPRSAGQQGRVAKPVRKSKSTGGGPPCTITVAPHLKALHRSTMF